MLRGKTQLAWPYALAVGVFMLTGSAAFAQPVDAVRGDTAAPKPAPNVFATDRIRSEIEQRRTFNEKMEAIEGHHEGIVLPGTPANLVTPRSAPSIPSAPATVIKPSEQRQNKWPLYRRTSVTGTAGITLTSPITEPSVATRGNEILVTGNWWTAFSVDGGKTFGKIDPFAVFGQGPVGKGFCCDQLVIYNKRADAFFWYLQGINNDQGNTVKLFVAPGKTFTNPQTWKFYELTSPQILGQNGYWLDFPDMASNDKFLFISSNVFKTKGEGSDRSIGSVVLRIPINEAVSGATINYRTTFDKRVMAPRFSHGSKSGMYWGSHVALEYATVLYWDDAQPAPTERRYVKVRKWTPATPATVAPGVAPNGRPWLLRRDSRMTMGVDLGTFVAFGWTAGADKQIKMPHSRMFVVAKAALKKGTDKTAVFPASEPFLWSNEVAFAYPTAAMNSKGQLGIAFAFGGPANYPSYGIGVLTKNQNGALIWDVANAIAGKSTPKCRKGKGWDLNCGVWGDYFTVHPHGSRPDTWVTAGYTIDSGDKGPVIANTQYLWFGYGGTSAVGAAPAAEQAPAKPAPAKQ